MYMYISLPTSTHSQNSLPSADRDIEISSHGASLKFSRRPSQSA